MAAGRAKTITSLQWEDLIDYHTEASLDMNSVSDERSRFLRLQDERSRVKRDLDRIDMYAANDYRVAFDIFSNYAQTQIHSYRFMFKGVAIFTNFLITTPTEVAAADIPIVPAAILRILHKVDTDESCVGLSGSEDWQQRVQKMEVDILNTLEWSIDPITIESWITMFRKRFLIRDGSDELEDSMNDVWAKGLRFAELLLRNRPTAALLRSPHRVAQGLFVIATIATNILPKELLDPGWMGQAPVAEPHAFRAAQTWLEALKWTMNSPSIDAMLENARLVTIELVHANYH